MGFVLVVCPAVDIPPARLLPDTVASAVRPNHRQVTGSRSVRGFSPLRRFTPRRCFGFVAPRSRPGFIAFRDGTFRQTVRRSSLFDGTNHHSAQCGSHPPKNSPRQQPYCVTAAVALLPFDSHLDRKHRNAHRSRYAPTSRHSVRHPRCRSISRPKTAPFRALTPPTTTLSREPGPPISRSLPAEADKMVKPVSQRHRSGVVPRVSPRDIACLATAKPSSALQPRFSAEAKIRFAAPASRAADRGQLPVPRSTIAALPRRSPSEAPFWCLAPCRSSTPHRLDLPGIPLGPAAPLGSALPHSESYGWHAIRQ